MRAIQILKLQGDDMHYLCNQGWEPVVAFRHDDGDSCLFQVGETVCVLQNENGDRLTMQQAARICDPAGTEDADDENQQYTIRVSDGQIVRVPSQAEVSAARDAERDQYNWTEQQLSEILNNNAK
jgi:hypothetical protein